MANGKESWRGMQGRRKEGEEERGRASDTPFSLAHLWGKKLNLCGLFLCVSVHPGM